MNTTLNSNGRNYGNTDLFLGYITVLLFILLIFILKIVIVVNIKCKNLTDKLKCMCEFVFRYFTINRENENKLYCQVCLHIRGICYSDSKHECRLYIYIYAFSRRFYPKRLTVHSGYACSLGIEPTTFCAANTMLYH